MSRKIIDWESIRSEYVSGTASYRQLSEKYGLSYRGVVRHGAQEGWAEKRKKYRDQLQKKTLDKISDRQSADAAEKLLSLQKAADLMSETFVRIVSDPDQFYRHLVTLGTLVEEKTYRKADARAIRDIASAMKDIASVVRNVHDIPTAQERTSIMVATERLRIEQTKAEAEAAGSEDIKIEFGSDEQEGWAE